MEGEGVEWEWEYVEEGWEWGRGACSDGGSGRDAAEHGGGVDGKEEDGKEEKEWIVEMNE